MSERDSIEYRIMVIENDLSEIKDILREYDTKIKSCEDVVKGNGYEDLIKTVEELQLLVLGERRVGAKPLREMVDEIYTAYTEVKLTTKQVRTLMGFFGITTLAGIVAFVTLLLKILELLKEFP